ncbi:MAG: hypothetical protein JXQ82_04165 [Methanomicrobiaceae archaeon]|nr:hypothetical protein [Methanomicrobiaceae archaeon]
MNQENEIPTKENYDAIIKYSEFIGNNLILEENKDEIEKTGTCDAITEFTKVLYYNNWLINTKWQGWTSEAEYYFGNPEMIASADIETLRKILTVHVRIDRLFPGDIADIIKRGYLSAILNRINDFYTNISE